MNAVAKRKTFMAVGAMVLVFAVLVTMMPAFAAPQVPGELSQMLDSIIFYVGLIFRVVGIILGVYAIGQMIMAFKDENPDAKTKAATLLVVSIILIALPSIIEGMNLKGMLTK